MRTLNCSYRVKFKQRERERERVAQNKTLCFLCYLNLLGVCVLFLLFSLLFSRFRVTQIEISKRKRKGRERESNAFELLPFQLCKDIFTMEWYRWHFIVQFGLWLSNRKLFVMSSVQRVQGRERKREEREKGEIVSALLSFSLLPSPRHRKLKQVE